MDARSRNFNDIPPQSQMMTDHIEQYREYRSIGKDLNSKLLKSLNDDELVESAEFLDMTDEEDGEEVIYHDGELDMTVQSDFAIHEIERDGSTGLEQFYQEERWENEIERELVEALRKSYTSLFEIEAARSDERVLVLRDLLDEGDSQIELTDIKLSQTAHAGAMIFFRPVRLPEMTVTSGLILPFEAPYKDHLLEVNQQVMERTDSRPKAHKKFYIFYKMYQKYGSLGFMM